MINSVSTLAIRGVALALLLGGWGVRGWITGELVGFALTILLLWPRVLSDLKPSLPMVLVRQMLPYGLALTPALFAHWIMVGADRYMMLALLDNPREAIGLYSVGERISTVIQMVNFAFVLGWQRFAFENLQRQDGGERVAQGLTFYAAFAGFVGLGLALLGDDLTNAVLPSAYNAGTAVIPALTLAGLLGGVAELVGVGLQQTQRTGRLSMLTLGTALLQLVVLCWAIPHLGIMGAAYASLLCQSVKLVLVWWASQRAFPIPWEFRRLTLLATVLLACFFIGSSLNHDLPNGWVLGQVGFVLLAPALIFLFGFLNAGERQRLGQFARRLRLAVMGRTSPSQDVSGISERTDS